MVFKLKKKSAEVPPQAPDQADTDAASTERNKDEAPPETAPLVEVPVIEYQFGIADRLTETVAVKWAPQSTKRSPDLVPLMKKFEEVRKRLRHLIATTKKFHSSIAELDMNRLQMVNEISTFAEGSPIEGAIGKDENSSFLAVYDAASSKVAKSHEKFDKDVLNYIIEWESVVSTRVDKEMEAVKKLRKDYNHYTGKVEALRKKVTLQESKGKSVDESTTEKLDRNDEKLVEASAAYEAAAGPLCVLIEEIVQRAFKDMYPLALSLMKWESDRSQFEAAAFSKLNPDRLTICFRTADGKKTPPSKTASSKSAKKPDVV